VVAIAAMGWKPEENQNKWNAKNEREQREALYRRLTQPWSRKAHEPMLPRPTKARPPPLPLDVNESNADEY